MADHGDQGPEGFEKSGHDEARAIAAQVGMSGPWDTEPDRVEWRHATLPCLVVRNQFGAWCGYAAVPPGHPLHGKSHDAVDGEVSVHGGVTYGAACQGHICHVPEPGEPADVWWIGFDCGHAFDLQPWMVARMKREVPGLGRFMRMDVYRDLSYVKAEVEQLAEQLAGMARHG